MNRRSHVFVRATLFGIVAGLVFGALALAIGLFGPMLLLPKSNLGPLVGGIMSPLGFVLGFFGGMAYELYREDRFSHA